MTDIVYPARFLAAVAIAQSSEESRYYLRGVCFEPDGVAIATDGHMLSAVRVEENGAVINTPGIYPISRKAQVALKSAKAKLAVIAGGILTVQDKAGCALYMEPCVAIDGTFPDWRRIVPSGDLAPTEAAFSDLILSRLAATAKTLGGESTALTLRGSDPRGPHVVRYGGELSFFSIAMPMHHDPAHHVGVPSWVCPTGA